MLISANPEVYSAAVREYLARLSPQERAGHDVARYLSNARYNFLPAITWRFKLPITAYILVNRGVQYDLPHTMGRCIIIPEKFTNLQQTELEYVLHHEIMHVFMRYYWLPNYETFIRLCNMVPMRRGMFPREITNPDTYGHYALRFGGGLIFPVLYTPNDVAFFVIRRGETMPAGPDEISYYNSQLQFMQNYHPAEMFIEAVLRNYFA